MSYSGPVQTYGHNLWSVFSYGRGAAYCLRKLRANGKSYSVFLQGDDADQFREATQDEEGWWLDNCEERFGDYSEVMQPDDEEVRP